MPDDNFRAFRSRDPQLRDETDQIAADAGDPLAELARLIGQSDPYLDAQRAGGHGEVQPEDDVQPSGDDWPAEEQEEYGEEHADDRYAPPPAQATETYPPFARPDRGYEDEPAPRGDRYFSGSAAQFTGFREEPDVDYRNEQVPAVRARELPAYATAEPDDGYGASGPDHAHGDSYAADDYYGERTGSRRRGVVAVMAVLGLVVLGTAGAFGYRAMFGGSMIPSLPPIIKPSGGPNKIMPSTADSNSRNGSETSLASAGSTDSLVSREEQPINVEPAKPPPRVVANIPVAPAPNGPPPGLTIGAGPGPVSTANASAPAPAWPPAPPPMPNAAPAPTPTPGPAQVTGEPRRIHTVTIRSDQAANSEAAPAAPPPAQNAPRAAPAAARSTPRAEAAPPKPKPTAMTNTSRPAANAPLSIVPGGQPEVPAASPARTHAVAPPVAIASATPEVVRSGSGRYAVQVTSQRSESEAQASYRELQAKFPHQLGGRQPIIRRADLGAKGTYYRALVGPFASAEEAASMCSGLKAAGGNCLVQKN